MRRALIAVSLMLATLAVQAEEPGLARGFSPDKVFDFQSGLDTVNTFQGNLSIHLPLGPGYPVNGGFAYGLKLAYNAKVWDYETISGHPFATPNRRSNAGVGWLLSLGRLITPSNGTSTTGDYDYESPDGAVHSFWETLHDGTPGTALSGSVTHVKYTRDGSYLRLLVHDYDHDGNSDEVDLESPDGLIRSFDPANGNLMRIRDRLGNGMDIAYPTSLAGTPCPATDTFAWRLTDTQSARTNYVCFKYQPYFDSTYDGQVERVVLAAPPDPANGTARTTTFVFNYLLQDIRRGCHSTYPNAPSVVDDVPTLASVTQNPGTSEAMTWSFTYNTTHTNSVCESGTLASYALPTGATVDYTYRYWWLPQDQCAGPFRWNKNYTGIATRTIRGPHIPDATWTYSSQQSNYRAFTTCAEEEVPVYRLIPPEEVVTSVIDPLGNVTEQYYSTWPSIPDGIRDESGTPIPGPNSPNGFRTRDYGLPFTRMPGTNSGNYLLSQRVYTAAGYAAQPKTALRSTYLIYETDYDSCAFANDACLAANQRITGERVVYHDDNGRTADRNYSGYDGLGNMRQVSTNGTFTNGNVRTTYTAFNERDPQVNPVAGSDGVIASGTYPGSFNMPTLAHAWILGTASSVRVTEGSATATVQTCYEPATGFLRAQRVLKGTGRDDADLLTTFGRDFAGNLTYESYAGGDVAANAPTSGTLCAAADAPPTAEYSITHGYDLGVRTTSQYANASFLTLDQTIHGASGVTLSARDSAGHATAFSYDRTFRLKKVTPTGLVATTYDYFMPTGSGSSATPARVEEKTTSAQGLGSIETHYQYDALGRVWRRKTRMPDDSWSVTETHRNGLGWPQWTSKAQTLTIPPASAQNPSPTEYDFEPDYKTFMTFYDPFGRAGTITEPDGHAITHTYAGVSTLTRTMTIGNGASAFPSSTKEVYDRQGRLRSVTEALGTAEESTATYGYDVGGRLSSVAMPGSGGTQTRLFQYDHRGFLEFEEHPELGASGYGRTWYGPYDARGHAHRRITGATDGPFDLTFVYDSAERVTSVSETPSGRTLTLFDYDDPFGAAYGQCSGSRCNGRLAAAARFNYFDDLGAIAVTESYHYDGPAGAITRRDQSVGTSIVNGATAFEGQDFFVSQTYNDLGATSTLTYPCRKNAGGFCTSTPRTIQNGYTNGLLTSVSGFATSLTYQASGLLGTVVHANSVSDTVTAGANGMARPCSMLTYRGTLENNASDPCGVTPNASAPLSWTTGLYQYDGAGNITSIGDTAYTYDAFSRLRGWTQSLAGGGSNSTLLTMDTFGNQLQSTMKGCGAPVDGKSRCFTTSALSMQVAGTTNHYVAATYDAAGNVVTDVDQRTFTYDAFNRTKTTNASGRQFRFLYGPDEERIALIERVPVGSTTRNRTTWTLRGFNSELLSSWKDDSTTGTRVWTWKEDEIRRGSSLLASVNPTGTLHYSLDHLGSPRVVTDAGGNLVGYQTFAPFGRGGTSDGGSLQFTGHERDSATLGGNADVPDYMHARFYGAQWGRFLSVDPARDSADVAFLQSWNRYSYVRNNPLGNSDPDGRLCVPCAAAGAFAAVAAESYRQIKSDEPVNNGRLLAAVGIGAAAGAVFGAAAKAAPIAYNAALANPAPVAAATTMVGAALGVEAPVVGVASPYVLERTQPLTMGRKAFSKLVAEIKADGIKETIKYVMHAGKKYIVDGHHRVHAAKLIGLKEVPIERVELPYGGFKTVNDLNFSQY